MPALGSLDYLHHRTTVLVHVAVLLAREPDQFELGATFNLIWFARSLCTIYHWLCARIMLGSVVSTAFIFA